MNATDYLMFNVVFIGNNLRFVSSRFNMCNKFISIRFEINIEPVRPSTSTVFFKCWPTVYLSSTERVLRLQLPGQLTKVTFSQHASRL